MKRIFLIIIATFMVVSSYAQAYGEYNQYANINFEDGTSKDVLGNADAVLLNGATIVADAERKGNVMHFDAAQRGHLKFQKSPLNDEMTLSFWFRQEDLTADSFWRMIFAFYGADGSNLYYTPLTNWSTNSYFVFDNKSYNVYKSIASPPLKNNIWTHIAIVFDNTMYSVYQNGKLISKSSMLTKLSDLNTNRWFFGNQPELVYNMTGSIDDIQIYHSALSANQIDALKDGITVPEAVDPILPFAWFPLYSDLNDKMGKSKIEENAGVTFVSGIEDRPSVKINDKGFLKFNSKIIGSGISSISYMFKMNLISSVDDKKYLLKYNSNNGDFIGIRLNMENDKTSLQLVSNIGDVESVLSNSGSKYIKENEWNSLVFVQTYTTQGTPAIRVYLNGYSAMVKARVDINALPCTNFTFGDNKNGIQCNLTELKMYRFELTPAQALSYHNSQANSTLFIANVAKTYQTICNFGSSDGWCTQPVGLYFSDKKKEEVAKLLFSTEDDENGNPLGIGLSAWRFNIGAGTYEQGDKSRITTPERRTECFLNADGTYDWSKQAGQRWFLEKAVKTYNVKDIIGWQNSPPVYYTVRGLGFREFGDAKKTILKADKFDDFAKFLANVVKHFKEEGIKINYISPLNEPQWDWTVSAIGANNSQEGSPWTNEEIRDVVRSINSQFVSDGVDSKIFISEAGSINTLLKGTGVAYDQLNKLWNPSGSCFIGQNLNNFSNIISSHSYWADESAEALVNTRQSLKDRMTDLGDYQYWQTEYSLLGNGYKFGFPNNRILTPMESGISLARVIHNDLSIANATGWQWWTTFELGKNMSAEDRYALIRLALKTDKSDGVYEPSKLLYTLGNYSRFIRPGMKRIDVSRSDNATDIEAVSTQMVSAFYDEKTNNVVMVVVNASAQDCGIKLNVENLPNGIQADEFTPYITTDLDSDNIKRYPAVKSGSHYVIPGTSVVTFVSKANALSVEQVANSENKLIIYPNPVKRGEEIVCKVNGATRLIISDINGREISRYDVVDSNSDIIQLSSDKLDLGFYIITSISKNGYIDSKKIVVK